MQTVSFDCDEYRLPPPGQKRPVKPISSKDQEESSTKLQELTSLGDLSGRDLKGKLQQHMDDLTLASLHGKNRRRFLQLRELRDGRAKAEKPPKVPAKILAGMRTKAKERKHRSQQHAASNHDIKLMPTLLRASSQQGALHPLLVGSNSNILKDLNQRRYQMRGKEERRLKERERGMMLSRRLQQEKSGGNKRSRK